MLLFALALAASPALDRCLNRDEAAQGVTLAMARCFTDDYKRADGDLNRAYGAAMQRLSARRKATLRTSQRAWIKRRDAVCARVTGPGKGTIQQLEYPQCLARETRARTAWLKRQR
jgi:uncharacterized protein YecT (DUF1311 family)